VIDRLTLEAERKQGSKNLIDKARETVDQTLKEHVPDPLPADVEKDLKNKLKEIAHRYSIESLPFL
jgi:trimethylamine:corrinoid methyltransferase-like protein